MVALLGAEMGFAENLKRLRKAREWSQDQMAKRADIPLRTYQNWEMGHREPRLGALVRLAKTLGVSADELLKGVGEETAEEPEDPKPTRRRKK